jgi:putative glycosyltransferase (TIGR04348 family)
MARIAIDTPAPPGSRTGNRQTAARWARMLRADGHRVSIGNEWKGERCDVLVALHAHRSHASVRRYRQAHPQGSLIVVLTGTDLYRDLPASRAAHESLRLADRIIVLQPDAVRLLPTAVRAKTRVVFQSSDARVRQRAPARPFRIAVVGHLRKVKDPFRTALALAQLKGDYEVVQVGGALDPAMSGSARRMMKRESRYRWTGSVPHGKALRWIARSHLLVVSSVMEGGANVICEAARIGTPVLASRVSGNVGMLGGKYPGYFPLHDERALAALIRKYREQKEFQKQLKRAMAARRACFSPAAERKALRGVIEELRT